MKIIGICGFSGCGKTTLSTSLSKKYQKDVSVLFMDDYFKDFSNEVHDSRPNIDYPEAVDFSLLLSHLEKLKNNQDVLSPIYDLYHLKRTSNSRLVPAPSVLIIEGFLIYQNDELRNLFDTTIFIDTDPVKCLIRRIQRDSIQYGQDIQQLVNYFEKYAYPAYFQYVKPSKIYADLILKDLSYQELFEVLEQEILQYF